MTLDDLNKVDLRLLVAFNTLMEERSVSRAAERLGLSQPAMSRSLQKLRKLFGDDLFIRQSHGLSPSPRAEQIQNMLRPLLNDMLRLVAPVTVDPAQLRRCFRIGVLDLFSHRLVSPLILRLREIAPHVRLKIVNLEAYSMEELASGQLDFIINLGDEAPANIHSRLLGYEEPVCLLRAEHPLAGQPLTAERFFSLPFVHFWVPGFNENRVLDKHFAAEGLSCDIVLETNNLMTAMNAVCDADLAMIAGRRVHKIFPRTDELIAMSLPLPLTVQEQVAIRLLWHRRYHDDVEHQWMRELIDSLFWPVTTE
ncbi:MAG: LysR family transcriptional regulator [Amphritea sp.]